VGGDVVVVHDVDAKGAIEEVAEADGGDEVIREEWDADDAADGGTVKELEEVGVAFPSGKASVGDAEAVGAEGLFAAEVILGTDGEGVWVIAEEAFDENAETVAWVGFVGGDDGVRSGQGGVREGGIRGRGWR
jgi:hypothetical protein